MKTNSKKLFSFYNVKLHYDSQNILYAYFLTDDNDKNKEVSEMICDMWYKRIRLVQSTPIVEVHHWFEYTWMWIYISKEYLADMDRDMERRSNIRKAPILSNKYL